MDKELADQTKEGVRRIQGWTLLSSKVLELGNQREGERGPLLQEVPALCTVLRIFVKM